MLQNSFPTINAEATGKKIKQLRQARGFSVKDLQEYFGFEAPQAIYRWQDGKVLPKVDNLVALSMLFDVRMEEIIVLTDNRMNVKYEEPRDGPRGSGRFGSWRSFILPFAPSPIEQRVQ